MLSLAALSAFYKAYRPLVNAALAALLLAALYGAWDWDRESHANAVADQKVAEVKKTYDDAIAKQKADAATTLAIETAKTRTAEQALTDFKATQEKTDADHQTTVADLHARLVAAAGPTVRLRDPNAPGRGPGCSGAPAAAAATAGNSPGDGAEAGGLFSEQATQLLEQLTNEADAINVAYASCRAERLNLGATEQALSADAPTTPPPASPPAAPTTQPE